MADFRNSHSLDVRMQPNSALGIVSPCSSCTNRRSLPEPGFSSCPRVVLARQQADAARNGTDFEDQAHLTLTGLEANPFATPAPNVFANPVYDLGRDSLYVWVARFVDNTGGANTDGSEAYPPITSPDFLPSFTDHIQCMALPMVPADTLAEYYTRGRMKESDTVWIQAYQGQNLNRDGSSQVFGGSVRKLSTHGAFPVAARPLKDDHPRGT